MTSPAKHKGISREEEIKRIILSYLKRAKGDFVKIPYRAFRKRKIQIDEVKMVAAFGDLPVILDRIDTKKRVLIFKKIEPDLRALLDEIKKESEKELEELFKVRKRVRERLEEQWEPFRELAEFEAEAPLEEREPKQLSLPLPEGASVSEFPLSQKVPLEPEVEFYPEELPPPMPLSLQEPGTVLELPADEEIFKEIADLEITYVSFEPPREREKLLETEVGELAEFLAEELAVDFESLWKLKKAEIESKVESAAEKVREIEKIVEQMSRETPQPEKSIPQEIGEEVHRRSEKTEESLIEKFVKTLKSGVNKTVHAVKSFFKRFFVFLI